MYNVIGAPESQPHVAFDHLAQQGAQHEQVVIAETTVRVGQPAYAVETEEVPVAVAYFCTMAPLKNVRMVPNTGDGQELPQSSRNQTPHIHNMKVPALGEYLVTMKFCVNGRLHAEPIGEPVPVPAQRQREPMLIT